jgi:hypothetical protein
MPKTKPADQTKPEEIPKGGPLPDDPPFNKQTIEAMRELEEGKGTRYKSVRDMFKKLGF